MSTKREIQNQKLPNAENFHVELQIRYISSVFLLLTFLQQFLHFSTSIFSFFTFYFYQSLVLK